MARIRTIKPQFFTSDTIGDLPPLVRLLFVGLWCLADRGGRLEDRPRRIKAELLPYDEANADDLLTALANAKLIIRYEAQDAKYIQIVNFSKHQHCHVNEPFSVLPPPENYAEPANPLQAPYKNSARTVPIRQEQEQEQEGNKKEKTLASAATAAPAASAGVASGEAHGEIPKQSTPRKREPQVCDEVYLDELQADPAFKALDVRLCHAKMLRWCKERKKQPTRQRFIAWLMREDQPMNGNGTKPDDSLRAAIERRAAERATKNGEH
jgi:hypothetical protein